LAFYLYPFCVDLVLQTSLYFPQCSCSIACQLMPRPSSRDFQAGA
jgi:hypothetical protein